MARQSPGTISGWTARSRSSATGPRSLSTPPSSAISAKGVEGRPGEAETLALLGDLCDDDGYRKQADGLYAVMGVISPRGR